MSKESMTVQEVKPTKVNSFYQSVKCSLGIHVWNWGVIGKLYSCRYCPAIK